MTILILILLGPLKYFRQAPLAALAMLILVLVLTIVTQIGGLIFWLSLPILDGVYKRAPKFMLLASALAFLFIYSISVFLLVPLIAPIFGRMPLPMFSTATRPLKPVSVFYCLMARNYVRPEAYKLLTDISQKLAKKFPGSVLIYYDANFPFINGFPLLPHLSHNDGRKIDLAFFYQDKETGQPVGSPPSPIGYWAYEQPLDGESQPCLGRPSLLRWDFDFLQPLFDDVEMDEKRTRYLMQLLIESNQVQKILIEPHLKQRLSLGSQKVRFQGCRAARHDDHIHFQIN